jgi:hypothetical protein
MAPGHRTSTSLARALSAWGAALVVVVGIGAGVSACTPTTEDRPPAPLSLQLATRQSCGVLSGLDYETSCMAAVYVRVLDATRTQIYEECRPLDEAAGERAGELRELLLRGEPLISFTKLSTNQTVTFEVRGLHDVGLDDGADLCAGADDSDHWLFWGVSAAVDLTRLEDKDGLVVPVVLDCRDCTYACGDQQCFGCPAIGASASCPAGFPPSFCAPTTTCDKACETASDCFGGARACVEGKCDTDTVNGGLCSPCGGSVGCADGLTCVARGSTQRGFCAPPCPDETCAAGTKCNRLGNNLVLKTN